MTYSAVSSSSPERSKEQAGDVPSTDQSSFQLSQDETDAIVAAIVPPARFLVFGLGHDSVFWANANQGGTTVFLESDPVWFKRITELHPELNAYLVEYGTARHQWRALLRSPDQLAMKLPDAVREETWDCILVDGPTGHRRQTPGRMKSIYAAASLIKPGGDIFVHDCHRQVERIYCDTFLGNANLVKQLRRKKWFNAHVLRHYRMTHPLAS